MVKRNFNRIPQGRKLKNEKKYLKKIYFEKSKKPFFIPLEGKLCAKFQAPRMSGLACARDTHTDRYTTENRNPNPLFLVGGAGEVGGEGAVGGE